MNYYFLKKDLEKLNRIISKLQNKLKEAQKDKHLATTQSSETWHDNFGFEEGVRRINQLASNISELLEIKRKAAVISPAKGRKVGIGSIVIYKDESHRELNIKIGSYFIADGKAISYNSPLGKILMGAKSGEKRIGLIGTNKKEFIIIKIINN